MDWWTIIVNCSFYSDVATAFCSARNVEIIRGNHIIKIKIDSGRFKLLHAFDTEKSSNTPLLSPRTVSNIPRYF